MWLEAPDVGIKVKVFRIASSASTNSSLSAVEETKLMYLVPPESMSESKTKPQKAGGQHSAVYRHLPLDLQALADTR